MELRVEKFKDPKTGEIVIEIKDDGTEVINPKWLDKIKKRKEEEENDSKSSDSKPSDRTKEESRTTSNEEQDS